MSGGKGRFAPSPSGRMHIGNALSALIAWASARVVGDSFIVRIEDLDDRCKDPLNAQAILEDLKWLGIDWDEDPLSQAKSGISRYGQAYERLESMGLVYPCYCSRADLHAASAPHASDGTPIYSGRCRKLDSKDRIQADEKLRARTGHGPSWRVKCPDAEYHVVDGCMGAISQNLASECGDFVVKRSDGVYAYQLAVVVDDAWQGITQVVRGSDLLTSAPRQAFLYETLGLEVPQFYHHPMLLAKDGRRLSKRDRDLDLGYLRGHAFEAEELVGSLAQLCGILPCDSGYDDSVAHLSPIRMSAGEFAEEFDWSNVKKSDVRVDLSTFEA